MKDTIAIVGLCAICILVLTLAVNMTMWTINDWRYEKARRMRERLECERLKRELLRLEGRNAEL